MSILLSRWCCCCCYFNFSSSFFLSLRMMMALGKIYVYISNQLLSVRAVFFPFAIQICHCFWSRSFHIVVVQLAITQRVPFERDTVMNTYIIRAKWNALMMMMMMQVHQCKHMHTVTLRPPISVRAKDVLIWIIGEKEKRNTKKKKKAKSAHNGNHIIEINKSWTPVGVCWHLHDLYFNYAVDIRLLLACATWTFNKMLLCFPHYV